MAGGAFGDEGFGDGQALVVGVRLADEAHQDRAAGVAGFVHGVAEARDAVSAAEAFGIHADGALKDHGNYELYDEAALGPFPEDWHARSGRVVLTGEYGGKAGFRHVMDGLGIEVAGEDEELVFQLVQLCNAQTSRPLTDDELRLIAGCPRQLAVMFPGQLA